VTENRSDDGNAQHVFVIEDNELLVKMYRVIFSALGCGVIHASTQSDAMRLLEDVHPDLFIVDDRLPDGSGADTTRAIRACNGFSRVPIIATVTKTSQEVVGELEAAGIASVVTKPLDIKTFSALARRHLGSRTIADPSS
jgi:DNA-binding response OmpR family regulator